MRLAYENFVGNLSHKKQNIKRKNLGDIALHFY